jgi:hypothetical protein
MKYFQDLQGIFHLIETVVNVQKCKCRNGFMYRVILKSADEIRITKEVYNKLKEYFNENAFTNDDFISDFEEDDATNNDKKEDDNTNNDKKEDNNTNNDKK